MKENIGTMMLAIKKPFVKILEKHQLDIRVKV